MKTITFIFLTLVFMACGDDQKDPDVMGLVASSATETQNTRGDRIEKGDKGDKGEQGAAGEKGERGEKGEKGDKGDTGETGAQGAIGATGAQGIQGQTGSQGTPGINGTDGEDGANGQDGTDGEDAHKLTLIDMSDNVIGQVYYLSPTTNDFWVVSGASRMEIDQTEGTFPNAYLVFSGADCTGTKRLVITNGTWANTFVDARNTTLVQATGKNLGTFNYASRVAQTSSCANTSGSTLVSYATQVPSLPFTYPVGRVYIANE